MKEPLVSIVIVVFNGAGTIRHAIESVLGQTYAKHELVIIDGGSKDDTAGIVKSFGDRISYFISEKDNGVYDAMNKGIMAAKGEWILFLGADDVLYSNDILAQIFSEHDHSGIDFIYGDVEFTSNKKRYGGETNLRRLTDQNICHQAIFQHRDVYKKLGIFSIKYPVLADFEMNLRVFRDASLKKRYVPLIVTLFNNKGMSSHVLDRYFHADMLKVFLEEDKMKFLAPELQQYHFYHGIISLYSGKPGVALKQVFSSWISGRRKLFYFLFTFKFILRTLTGNRIIIKPSKEKAGQAASK